MLRTFDELGYRQEQRFHFELGLLKLVHLRRLLPIEEVLSQFPVGGGSRPGPAVATTRTMTRGGAFEESGERCGDGAGAGAECAGGECAAGVFSV